MTLHCAALTATRTTSSEQLSVLTLFDGAAIGLLATPAAELHDCPPLAPGRNATRISLVTG